MGLPGKPNFMRVSTNKSLVLPVPGNSNQKASLGLNRKLALTLEPILKTSLVKIFGA